MKNIPQIDVKWEREGPWKACCVRQGDTDEQRTDNDALTTIKHYGQSHVELQSHKQHSVFFF